MAIAIKRLLIDGKNGRLCPECGNVKLFTEFYKDKSRKNGIGCYCKSCVDEKCRKYRNTEPGKAANARYTHSHKGRKASKKATAKYKQHNADKIKARSILNHAVRDGKILRLGCEICGALAEAHHEDYAQPLNVRWLCKKHHVNITYCGE